MADYACVIGIISDGASSSLPEATVVGDYTDKGESYVNLLDTFFRHLEQFQTAEASGNTVEALKLLSAALAKLSLSITAQVEHFLLFSFFFFILSERYFSLGWRS